MNHLIERRKQIGIVISFIGIVLAGLVVLFILLNQNEKPFLFFYPDAEFKKLKEQRIVLYDKKKESVIEFYLIRDYLLGPIHYKLRMDLSEDIQVRNVWAVSNELLIVNFSASFERFAKSSPANCTWFVRGLNETMRINSRFKKVYYLAEGRAVLALADQKNLAVPISIDTPKQK